MMRYRRSRRLSPAMDAKIAAAIAQLSIPGPPPSPLLQILRGRLAMGYEGPQVPSPQLAIGIPIYNGDTRLGVGNVDPKTGYFHLVPDAAPLYPVEKVITRLRRVAANGGGAYTLEQEEALSLVTHLDHVGTVAATCEASLEPSPHFCGDEACCNRLEEVPSHAEQIAALEQRLAQQMDELTTSRLQKAGREQTGNEGFNRMLGLLGARDIVQAEARLSRLRRLAEIAESAESKGVLRTVETELAQLHEMVEAARVTLEGEFA